MNSDRKTAITFGILLISGVLFGILSSVPALEQPDYLIKLSSINGHVVIAALFQSIMATVYVCVAVIMYPIVKRYSEGMAHAYFGFRIIGAVFLFIGVISLLLLLYSSQRFVIEAQPDYFQSIGELIRLGRDWLNHIGMVLPWSIGGLILFYSFYQLKLIPKWLSIWGLIGYTSTLFATLLLLLDIIIIVTPIYFILNTPTAIMELVLAVYLIIKGFNTTVVASS